MVRYGFEIAATALVIFVVLWLGLNLINLFWHSVLHRRPVRSGNILMWVQPDDGAPREGKS